MMDKLQEDIVKNLTPDLLKSEYLDGNRKNKFFGHCYVATETYYHLLPDSEQDKYVPSILKVKGITHWFLKNKENGDIIDITKDQFNFELDYSKSRNCGFLTKTPSKRSLILINRILDA